MHKHYAIQSFVGFCFVLSLLRVLALSTHLALLAAATEMVNGSSLNAW